MKEYVVYMHISPSNKRYIGLTSMNEKKRWGGGNGYRSNNYFYRAIEKYGWDNFEHIIIARGLTEDEAKWLEIELIREWDSTNPNKGYNLTLGGESANGLIHTEETKRRMSEIKKGREVSEETRRRLSKALKGRKISEENIERMCGENNPMYGMCGELNPMYGTCYELSPNATKVIAIINGKPFMTFDCIKRGAEFFNCDSSCISKCCNGKRKSCGKYNGEKIQWSYLETSVIDIF